MCKEVENLLLQRVSAQYAAAEEGLLELLRIPSVEGEPMPGAPFGEEVRRALAKIAELAQNLGLQANLTDHYVTVDFGDGASPQALGILSHVDVVPFGEGWHLCPTGEIADDKIYGRGSLDDKGPTIATLYALAAIKDFAAENDIPLARPIRMIVGGNEESGSRCIKKYIEDNGSPAFGFSPDANFPVIFAEKGIVLMQAKGAAAQSNIKSIQAGTVVNAVPGKAEAVICGIDSQAVNELLRDKFNDRGISLTVLADSPNTEIKITAPGKAAHGSMPEKGKNAAALLLSFLSELPLSEAEHDAVSQINALFGQDYNGIAAGIATEDEISGALTLNMGTLNWQDSEYTVGLDMRYPISASFAEIHADLANICAENGIKLEISEHKEPLYVPTDQAPASQLLELYREYEAQAEPLAIGGGTYCRAFKNFVAFGPLRPQTNDLMHQADEYITKEDFKFLQRIYAQAIWRLASC